ncbi:MAG: 2-amino-4-hydroxy-6-hydroxymethyldihydropteridine diphosphokinase [Desulfobacterales bacterium]|nr:2-amino-4-hydroxy-6-hydroxymethyldihydropteridine diphosphokinase [Desulfobacterales bacterium]MDD4071835.1 2-amino-4-hydroxy-6-hydroxymethyldihydropteridine diphosphokinase [Desulfobacterales bacterium]MDD4392542.1 2-amino-4-hydroxy-6-hydroxymethyldihydropteridine diphosphokinase [Desulfobacterales bacterium]
MSVTSQTSGMNFFGDSHTAYISIGSNSGNKVQNCRYGIDKLIQSGCNVLLAQSSFYLTEPVDYADQEWFSNVVIKIETALDPFRLLKRLKDIERDAGRRVAAIRFGPRILDMDIILFEDMVINTSDLVVPHPRMHKRRFVLQPVCDIDPSVIHPVFNADAKYLLDQLDHTRQRIIEYPCG